MNTFKRVYLQELEMRRMHPNFEVVRPKGRPRLTCRGTVQPLDINAEYLVRIEYCPPSYPRVIVVSPELRDRGDGKPIPHTYGANRPCLFYPRADWTAESTIARSVIPWLSLWLVFYESWLVTGEWQGGGIEHGSNAKAAS